MLPCYSVKPRKDNNNILTTTEKQQIQTHQIGGFSSLDYLAKEPETVWEGQDPCPWLLSFIPSCGRQDGPQTYLLFMVSIPQCTLFYLLYAPVPY
jgi:hypothetical protein